MSKPSWQHVHSDWGMKTTGLATGIVCILAVLVIPSFGMAQDDTGTQDVGTSAAAGVDLDAVLAKAAPENVAELRAVQERVHSVVEQVMDATVGVRVGAAQGSGVIVSADGYIMTAGHVSGTPGRTATIIFPDGTQVRGETLGRHSRMDSGLIKITDESDEDWPHAELGTSDDLDNGEWVISLGHPGGYQRGREPVVRLGRVLERSQRLIRTDCTLVGGDSGGPLFDMDGKVIGIHSRISRNLSQNFHVPVATYSETWDQLAASEEIGVEPPRLGIRGADHPRGCEVTEVLDDLPALDAGIQVGDIITRFNDSEVQGINHLATMVQRYDSSNPVKIVLIRDGEAQELSIRFD